MKQSVSMFGFPSHAGWHLQIKDSIQAEGSTIFLMSFTFLHPGSVVEPVKPKKQRRIDLLLQVPNLLDPARFFPAELWEVSAKKDRRGPTLVVIVMLALARKERVTVKLCATFGLLLLLRKRTSMMIKSMTRRISMGILMAMRRTSMGATMVLVSLCAWTASVQRWLSK